MYTLPVSDNRTLNYTRHWYQNIAQCCGLSIWSPMLCCYADCMSRASEHSGRLECRTVDSECQPDRCRLCVVPICTIATVGRLRSAANVGTMSRMNPYETPHTADEQIPQHRRRKMYVAWGLIFAAGLMVGGMVTSFVVRVQATRAAQAESMRARQAAERAREAALKSEGKQNPSAP